MMSKLFFDLSLIIIIIPPLSFLRPSPESPVPRSPAPGSTLRQSRVVCSSRGRDVDMPTDARVLVVENDVRLRNALAELIRSWGYEAESAPDGQQALEKISSFDPVLVLSDLRMLVMGGMDLLKQVRETRPGINFI